MKISKKLFLAFIPAVTLSLFFMGCGGGGGGSTPAPSPQTTSSVSGVASKGHLSGATVTAYQLSAGGVKGSTLGSATTDANGAYSIDLGTYTGAVLIEASGGAYTDEATGQSKTNTALLRAAVTNVSGNVTAAVTPLTEIAVQKAGTLTAANISAANTLVSNMIGGTNIITTMPANVLVSSSSTTGEKNYGLALAAISQMVSNGTVTTITDAITAITADLADSKLDTTGTSISSALSTFITGSGNQTGLTTGTATVVSAINDAINNVITPPSTPPTPSNSLQGTYRHIDQSVGFYTYASNNTTYGASMSYGDTATFILDGQDNYTASGSGINYDMQPASNTVISTPDTFSNVTGTYTVGNGGMVTFDWSSTPSWVSIDGSVIMNGEASASGTLHQSEQRIEIKGGTGMSNASLNGTYAMVSQSVGFSSGTGWAISNFYGDHAYMTFDGAGNATWDGDGWFYEMNHVVNTVSITSHETGTGSLTYAVSSNGAVTIPGAPYGGWVSADGNVFILGGAYVDGDIQASEQDIAVKLGSNMNNASLNGTFKLVMQSAGFFLSSSNTGTVAGSMVHTYGPDTMVFDGLGGCSWTSAGSDTEYSMSGNNIYTYTYPIGQTTSCTYSVSSNGTTTFSIAGFNLTIWLSANGNYFIWGGGGWSNDSISGGAIPTLDGGPVCTEQAIGVKVQ